MRKSNLIMIGLIITVILTVSQSIQSKTKLEESNYTNQVRKLVTVNHEILKYTIGPLLNVEYLGETKNGFQNIKQGIVWKEDTGSYISLPVKLGYDECPTSLNVIFKIVTSSPFSTLTSQAITQLSTHCPSKKLSEDLSKSLPVLVNNHSLSIYESHRHPYHSQFNILGTDFLKNVASLSISYSRKGLGGVKIEFNEKDDLKSNQQNSTEM